MHMVTYKIGSKSIIKQARKVFNICSLAGTRSPIAVAQESLALEDVVGLLHE